MDMHKERTASQTHLMNSTGSELMKDDSNSVFRQSTGNMTVFLDKNFPREKSKSVSVRPGIDYYNNFIH